MDNNSNTLRTPNSSIEPPKFKGEWSRVEVSGEFNHVVLVFGRDYRVDKIIVEY